jgi:hypothetical protein
MTKNCSFRTWCSLETLLSHIINVVTFIKHFIAILIVTFVENLIAVIYFETND